MINENQKENLESRFIQFLSNTIHTREIANRLIAQGAPMDQSFLKANAFYSKVLLDVCLGALPRRGEFDNSGFEEGDDAVYQGALYLYHRWRKLPRQQAIRHYCQYLNGLFRSTSIVETKHGFAFSPELFDGTKEIIEALGQ
ncbi:MAG: hypothetical protein J6328_04230 [Bacilli bacterium]|nr:hypothetical protein [Bacilli bacterium]